MKKLCFYYIHFCEKKSFDVHGNLFGISCCIVLYIAILVGPAQVADVWDYACIIQIFKIQSSGTYSGKVRKQLHVQKNFESLTIRFQIQIHVREKCYSLAIGLT